MSPAVDFDLETVGGSVESRALVRHLAAPHLVTAVPGWMDGTVPGREIGWLLVACAGLIALSAPLTMRLYRHKL